MIIGLKINEPNCVDNQNPWRFRNNFSFRSLSSFSNSLKNHPRSRHRFLVGRSFFSHQPVSGPDRPQRICPTLAACAEKKQKVLRVLDYIVTKRLCWRIGTASGLPGLGSENSARVKKLDFDSVKRGIFWGSGEQCGELWTKDFSFRVFLDGGGGPQMLITERTFCLACVIWYAPKLVIQWPSLVLRMYSCTIACLYHHQAGLSLYPQDGRWKIGLPPPLLFFPYFSSRFPLALIPVFEGFFFHFLLLQKPEQKRNDSNHVQPFPSTLIRSSLRPPLSSAHLILIPWQASIPALLFFSCTRPPFLLPSLPSPLISKKIMVRHQALTPFSSRRNGWSRCIILGERKGREMWETRWGKRKRDSNEVLSSTLGF